MRELTGQSVLISGGGSGLGAGAARYLSARGARITICGRRLEPLQRVAAEIGESCRPIQGDITQGADRTRIVEGAVAHGGALHALINNAGNMYRGPITELDPQRLLDIFNSNVVAAMLMTGLSVPHLAKTQGAVIFVGSVHTRRAFPGASPYAATKGAIEVLTRVLAAELGAQRIRVNCVVPGGVFTELNQRAGVFDDATALERLQRMTALQALARIGTAEEVAEAIAYLLAAEWTTGAVLDVDGGLGLGLTAA